MKQQWMRRGRRPHGMGGLWAALLHAAVLLAPASAVATGLLHTQGSTIVDGSGQMLRLRGVNLGGWFVMEPFMSPMDSSHRLKDTYSVMRVLQNRFGRPEQRRLMDVYQRSWITDNDVAAIAAAGFNAVRIPLWWGQFLDLDEPTPSGWRPDAFAVLDGIIDACRRHGVVAVLDMHGAIGGQSADPDTGRANRNRFWTDDAAQLDTAWLWRRIASHYRGESAIAGYDLLNEPAPPAGLPLKNTVWNAYDLLYRAVRTADPGHMIFIEDTFGSWSLQMLPDPRSLGWTNVVYESHVYPWPKNNPGISQDADADDRATRSVADFAAHAAWNVPGYIGEFNTMSADASAWRATVAHYDAAGLSWAVWSYKAVNGVPPNFWGYQDPRRWIARPDPQADTSAVIAEDWSGWTTRATFMRNPAMAIDAH